MLVNAVTFPVIVLAIHVMAVVLAFGIVVAWPLVSQTVERIDPRSVPTLMRARVLLGRTLVNPGLLLVIVAGVYLAAHGHDWKQFFVQWGIAASVVLGALEGALVMRQSNKLAEIAQRDIDAGGAGAGAVKWSDEYVTLRGRNGILSIAMAIIVLATVYVMAVN